MSAAIRAARSAPELIPALLAIGVFVAWAPAGGAFDVEVANPGVLFLVGLLAVSAFVFRDRLGEQSLATRIALGFLAAFAIWTFISIGWADDKGIAWEGANRTAGYLAVFALFAILPWRAPSAAVALGAFSFAIATVGVIVTLNAAGAGDPRIFFVSSRLVEPIGYHNASAALYLLAFWPALFLAGRREVPWGARGVMLAAAGVLLQLALVPQSRGALIALAVTAVVYVLLVPGRIRSAIVIAALTLAMLASGGALLEVYDAVSEGQAGEVLGDAVDQILLSALGLFAIGAAIGLLDRRVAFSGRVVRVAGASLAVVAIGAVATAAVVFVREEGSPTAWASERWDDFKSGSPVAFEGGTRLGGSLGTNRYDFWRVATDEFGAAPVAGIGGDNFAAAYLRRRESHEEPLHPHSLPVRVLSQTGIVGSLLFAGFLIAALTAAMSVRLRSDRAGLTPGVSAAATVAVVYWLAHSGADWLWALPAVSAPALAWLALAGRVRSRGAPAAEPATAPEALATDRAPQWTPARAGVLAGGSLVVVFIALSLLLPWMASRDLAIASANWGADPEAAFERIDRARGLNFLSAEPDLIAGTIAARLGDEERLRRSFEQALERRSDSWYANLQLGVHAAREGDRPLAGRYLREARRLNPGDPLILMALRALQRDGRALPLRLIDENLIDRVCDRVGRASELERCE